MNRYSLWTAAALLVGLSTHVAACSKSEKPSKKGQETAAEPAKPAEDTARAEPSKAEDPTRAERLAARQSRAAEMEARRTEATVDREMPPVLSVEDHMRRAEREIDDKNYRQYLDDIEKDISTQETRANARPTAQPTPTIPPPPAPAPSPAEP